MLIARGDSNIVFECKFSMVDIDAKIHGCSNACKGTHSEWCGYIPESKGHEIRSLLSSLKGNYLLVTKSNAIKLANL